MDLLCQVVQSYLAIPLNHPASVQLTAWLTAFNTADRKTLLEYHSGPDFPYSVASRELANIDLELAFAQFSGGLNIAEIESSLDPSTVVVVWKEKNRLQYIRWTMVVDVSKPNYPVTEFDIYPIITPIKFIPKDDPRRARYEKALKPLNTSMRRGIVDGISDVLRDQYVYPDLAEQLVAALETHFNNGDYNSFVDSEKFANQLTEDLHAVGHDLHMGIDFIERPVEPPNDGDRPPELPKRLEDVRRVNFGFESISLDKDTVPGKTIATLPISGFVPSKHFASDWKEIQGEIGKILSTVANADALLVDLRGNHGGSPNTESFMLSYFLENGPIHIADFVDRNGNIDESFSTLPIDELPAGTSAFGGVKPIWVLTNKETVSAAEGMAYDLQAFKRSNAVIGEEKTTLGAANPITNPRFICEEIFGRGWWYVGVPSVKIVNAVTGTNWERVGVIGDIVAGSGEWEGVDALEVGRRLAKVALEAEEPQEEL